MAIPKEIPDPPARALLPSGDLSGWHGYFRIPPFASRIATLATVRL